ncbi:hypothetical protein PV325_000206 [Microctonus aethiopoides]|nr:hypothetical protein PV325_000206 [Microctonus aethiopoides]
MNNTGKGVRCGEEIIQQLLEEELNEYVTQFYMGDFIRALGNMLNEKNSTYSEGAQVHSVSSYQVCCTSRRSTPRCDHGRVFYKFFKVYSSVLCFNNIGLLIYNVAKITETNAKYFGEFGHM